MNNEETEDISDPGKNPTPAIGILTIPTSGIEMHLSGLKAYGPDGIHPPPCFLKENAQEISRVLTDIYQDCINTGTVPSKWKHDNLCAIHEKGKKSDPSNYRPVSHTCIASKVLELIMHCYVMNHLW